MLMEVDESEFSPVAFTATEARFWLPAIYKYQQQKNKTKAPKTRNLFMELPEEISSHFNMTINLSLQ